MTEDQRWRDPHPDGKPVGPPITGTAERAKMLGRGLDTGARATARGAREFARGAEKVGRFATRQATRAASASGAGKSGLNRLIYMHAFNTAGDAAVAISLAGSLFFQVPSGQARGQVALFLGLTMLPFAIVAPLIGPFLDKFAYGRRWAIGATMAIRCFLCLVLAGAVRDSSALLFPAALGCLVSSKAYGVTRAAAVPRLLPESLTLVKANGRVSMSGIAAVAISAPIAGICAHFGAQWTLRYAFVLFVVAVVMAIRLPPQIDSAEGEDRLVLRTPQLQPGGAAASTATRPAAEDPAVPHKRQRVPIPGPVAFALRANCGPRWLSGFLTMFMAFLLRENPVGGLKPELALGLVIGAAGLGQTLGIVVASVMKKLPPALTVAVVLVADAGVALVATVFYGVLPLVLLGLTAGLGQALAKVSLDATIQTDIPERVQASAFARSDTTLQLAWVIGGFIGIAMPLSPPRFGLGVAFVALTAWTVYVLITGPASHRRRVAGTRAAGAATPAGAGPTYAPPPAPGPSTAPAPTRVAPALKPSATQAPRPGSQPPPDPPTMPTWADSSGGV